MGVDGGNGDGSGGAVDEREEVVGKVLATEFVGTVLDEIGGTQGVGTKDDGLSEIGVGCEGLDAEREGWGEDGGVGGLDLTEQELVGEDRIGCEEQVAESSGGEVV